MLHPAAIFVQIRTMGKGEWRRVFVEECYHCVFKTRSLSAWFCCKSEIQNIEIRNKFKYQNHKSQTTRLNLI